ncbi:hypothetical protein ZHAS_00003390 [Anopheles sinensis]|uniref:Uncharacterized protein n=1 Tax=Anopheles sinensis TaxID=74873 RepID=A0A084VE77_ANOSI|nr:hypothetical protein ZHAS_00003390 [Anopheles sinensis]
MRKRKQKASLGEPVRSGRIYDPFRSNALESAENPVPFNGFLFRIPQCEPKSKTAPNVRLSNGGIPIQNDIYLRDWSIKHELRNRAMIYDSGSSSSSTTTTTTSPPTNPGIVNAIGDSYPTAGIRPKEDTRSGSIKDCASVPQAKYIDQTVEHHSTHAPSESSGISIRILRTPHCNRSEHLPSSLKSCKLAGGTVHRPPVPGESTSSSSSTSTESSTSSSSNISKNNGKSKKWSKTRHKPKRQQQPTSAGSGKLDPNGALAPLLVSNILDKL